MTQGFIIELASGSFPGMSCFVFKDKEWGWSRHTEREMAHVFGTATEAQDAIREMLREIRYQAPEINHSLWTRLKEAEIVPA